MHSGLLSRYLSRRDVGIGLLLLDMAPSRCSACRNARTGTEEKNTIHFALYSLSLSLSFFFLAFHLPNFISSTTQGCGLGIKVSQLEPPWGLACLLWIACYVFLAAVFTTQCTSQPDSRLATFLTWKVCLLRDRSYFSISEGRVISSVGLWCGARWGECVQNFLRKLLYFLCLHSLR